MDYMALLLVFGTLLEFAFADTLQHIMVYIRHGARAPIRDCPVLDEKYKMKVPFHELTYVGQRQLYLLGRLYRQRYINDVSFLSDVFNSSEIHADASNVIRTVNSGYSFLLGLYPEGLQKMNPTQLQRESDVLSLLFDNSSYSSIISNLGTSSLPYDVPVIPLIHKNIKYDITNAFDYCPKYLKQQEDYFNSSLYFDLLEKNKEIINQMCMVLDLNCSSFFTSKGKNCYDSLIAYHFEGLTPQLNGALFDKIKQYFADISVNSFVGLNIGDTIMAYGFKKEILPQFEDIIYRNRVLPRARFHFSHDDLLYSLLHILKADDSLKKKFMPYASHIVFELRLKDNKPPNSAESYYLRILYNDKVIYSHLPYPEFVSLISQSSNLYTTYENFCSTTQSVNTASSSKYYLMIMFFSIFILFVCAFFIYSISKSNPKEKIAQPNEYGIISSS